MSEIKEALSKLDPGNDNHWTADGQPRIETVRMLAGSPTLSRDMVIEADPSFNRESARAAKAGVPPAPGPVAPVAPVDPILAQPSQDATPLSQEQEDALVVQHREAVIKRDALHAEKIKLDQAFADANALVDKLVTELDKRKPPRHVSLMHDIMAYQAAAQKEAEEKVKRAFDIRSLGIKPEDLQGKSALDQALARKRSRG